MEPRISIGFAGASLFVALLSLAVSMPSGCLGQCSDELTVVLLVSGVYAGTDLEIETLHVALRGPLTFPADSELLASIEAV
jgi:hypothetical protein